MSANTGILELSDKDKLKDLNLDSRSHSNEPFFPMCAVERVSIDRESIQSLSESRFVPELKNDRARIIFGPINADKLLVLCSVHRMNVPKNVNCIHLFSPAEKATYPQGHCPTDAVCFRPITARPNRSISSNCGLNCNKTKSTPAASNAATRSATCSAVPTNPDRNPRFDTE
jgi:hypothetical protein